MRYSYLLAIFIIQSFFVSCEKKQEHTQNTVAISDSANVLFAVTGFNSDLENVSLEKLKMEYSAGECFVFYQSQKLANNYFKAENKNVVTDLNDFRKKSNYKILIIDIENLNGLFKVLKIDSINYFDSQEKYKLKIGKGNLNITKLTLTGVTAITRSTGRAADNYGTDFLIEKIKDEFKSSDFIHVSNEVSIVSDCEFAGGTKFCSKEKHFQVLKDLGVNIVELTGNHNRDFGTKPFVDTYNWYKNNNMKTFGGGLNPEDANTPLILEMKDGKKLGFIGFNELCPCAECAKKENEAGANFYNSDKAKKVIEKMRNELKADFIITSVQFGESDSYSPTRTQEKICKYLIDCGADFVYGSQAHQVQQIEYYNGKPIYYGFGNFLFDQIHKEGLR